MRRDLLYGFAVVPGKDDHFAGQVGDPLHGILSPDVCGVEDREQCSEPAIERDEDWSQSFVLDEGGVSVRACNTDPLVEEQLAPTDHEGASLVGDGGDPEGNAGHAGNGGHATTDGGAAIGGSAWALKDCRSGSILSS